MYKEQSNISKVTDTRLKTRNWIDSVDLELIFMNSIAICIVLLAIVAADVFMG